MVSLMQQSSMVEVGKGLIGRTINVQSSQGSLSSLIVSTDKAKGFLVLWLNLT